MNDELFDRPTWNNQRGSIYGRVKSQSILLVSSFLAILTLCRGQCSLDGCLPNSCSQASGTQTCLECQSGYFLTPEGQCSRCASNCHTCTSATRCTGCLSSLFLNSATQFCEACTSHCTSCTDKDRCTACASGYSLDNSKNCIQDSSGQITLTALSPWAIVGYCLAGVLCMYLYQRRRLEDERKKLNETKKGLALLPEAPKEEPRPKPSNNTPVSARESHPLQLREGSKMGSRRELQLQNFSSAVSTARNLNVAVEVSVSNHYHISKIPSTKKVVIKNSGLFKPRRSAFGIADLSPHNLTEKVSVNGGKIPADKLSIASGVFEKELPTPTNHFDAHREEEGFNIVDLARASPDKPKTQMSTQPVIRARSTSNNIFKAFKNQKEDSVLNMNSDYNFEELGGAVGQEISPSNSMIKVPAPILPRGRSSTIIAKPTTLKDVPPMKEEKLQPPKFSKTDRNIPGQPPYHGANTARVLPKITIRGDPNYQNDQLAKSANNKSSAGSGSHFSNFREAGVLDLHSVKKSTPTASRIMIKQFSSEEKFEVVFSRQKLPPTDGHSVAGHSRRESVRSPLILVNSGKKEHSTPKSTIQD